MSIGNQFNLLNNLSYAREGARSHSDERKGNLDGRVEEVVAAQLPRMAPQGPPSISSHFLALIHGDSFVENSGYEGGDLTANIQFLLKQLRAARVPKGDAILGMLEESIEREASSGMDPANDPDRRMHIRLFHWPAQSYAQNLSQKVIDLKVGERFLMEGGWKNAGGGHVMLYIIERISEEEYAFTLLNTGSGMGAHDSHLVGYKKKHRPILRLRGIGLDEISSPTFFISLLELRCRTNEEGASFNHSAEDIYERILPFLKGKRDRAYEEEVALITPQKSGSCSWKALTKFLQVEMQDRALYKAFIFHLKKESLESYFDENFQQHKLTDEEIQLFKRSAEGFARYALRHFREGILSSRELSDARHLTAQILEAIQKREEEASLAKKEPLFEYASVKHTGFHTPLPFMLPDENTPRMQRSSLGPLQDLKCPPETLQELNLLLVDLLQFAHQLAGQGDDRGVIQLIKALIKMLPAGALQEEGYLEKLCRGKQNQGMKGFIKRYQGVDKQAVETTMAHLLESSRLLFSSIAALDKSSRGSPDQVGMLCVLIAINERLAHLVEDKWAVRLPPLLKGWELLPLAIIYDAKLNQLFQESCTFLDAQPNKADQADFHYDCGEGSKHLFFQFESDGSPCRKSSSRAREKLKQLIDALVAKDPHFRYLRGKTDREIFGEVVPQITEPSFPATFRILFQQYQLFDYFMRNPSLSEVKKNGREEVGSVRLMLASADQTQLAYQVAITGIAGNALSHQEVGVSSFVAAHTPISHPGFLKLLSSVGMIHASPYAPYKACYAPKVEGLSTRETREMAFTFSKKETFIPHLLSYFTEHPTALSDREFQIFLHYFFYGMNALETSLKSFPDSGRQLTQFFQEQLAIYQKIGDLPTQLYLFNLLTRLSQFGLISLESIQEGLFGLSHFATPSLESKRLKALVYAQLIASYHSQEALKEEEIIFLSVAYIYLQVYGYNSKLSHPHMKEQLEEVIDRVAESESFRQEEVARAIVKGVSQTVLSLPDGSWEGNFPLFQEADRPFRIDLSTFSLFERDLLLGGIPTSIANDPSFIHLFSSANYRAQEVGPGIYSLTIEGVSYRLFRNAVEDEVWLPVIIQREENNHWLTYLPHRVVRAFTPEGLVEGYNHWVSPPVEDQFQVLIEKSGSRERIAVMRGRLEPDHSLHVEECISIEGLQLKYVEEKAALSSFEEEGFYLNWGDQLLEFPRKKIHFTKGEGGKFFFSEDPTLYLSPIQSPPRTLRFFQGALKLEDEAGNRHFLFSREPVNLSSKGRGALQRGSSTHHLKKEGSYFQIAENEGVLTGSTPQENLFLAYLHLSDKNYAQAYRLLQLYLTAHPKGYSPNEVEIIEWIFEMIDRLEDPSPESCAIQLQILYLANRYLPSELKEQSPFKLEKRLEETLSRYYPMAHQMRTLAPSPHQERELLEASVTSHLSIPGAQARYRSLQGIVEEAEELPITQHSHSFLPPVQPLVPFSLVSTFNSIFKVKGEHFNIRRNFLLYGDDRLADQIDDWVNKATFFIPTTRRKWMHTLSLFKFHDTAMNNLSMRLKYVADYATSEQCDRLQEMWNKKDKWIRRDNGLETRFEWLEEIAAEIDKTHTPVSEEPTAAMPSLERKEEAPSPPPPLSLQRAPLPFPQVALRHPPSAEELMPLPEAPVAFPREVAQELTHALTIDPEENRVVQQEFARVQASIAAYTQEQMGVRRYRFDEENLQKMGALFGERAGMMHALQKELHQEILTLANKESLDPIEQLVDAMELLGEQKKGLSLDELLIFYLQDDAALLKARNPHLTEDNLLELTERLHHYLLVATEATYLEQVESAIKDLIESAGAEREEKELTLDRLFREKRAYPDPLQERTLLIFEYYGKMRLCKSQAELIAKMGSSREEEHHNLIAELIMGSGKSKVIMPLLGFLLSDGKNAPCIVVPDMLYETSLEDARRLSGERLRQSPCTIQIPEGGRLSSEGLDEILLNIQRMQRERGYFLLKDSTVKELILDFKETCTALGSLEIGRRPPDAFIERYRKLQEILNKLLTRALFDEADILFDHLKEMNFSSGAWLKLSEETQQSMENIFLAIAQEEELSRFFQLEKESDAPFDRALYEATIKPRLVEIILHTAGLTPDKNLTDYLLSDPEMREIPEEVLALGIHRQNHLALGKEMIANLFPHTLTKNCDAHFGMSHMRNSLQAIPYLRSNTPSEGSEFSSPFETMLYTTYYYARKGVSVDQIKKLMKECKEQALQEHKAYGTPFRETAGFRRFEALNLIPGKDLFSIQEGDIAEALALLNSDMRKKIAFSRAFGWREIGFYSKRLTCNVHHLVGAFSRVLGFTGTLWNGGSFPHGLNPTPQLATDGKTLTLLKSAEPLLHSYAGLSDLYAGLSNYHACIDTGAWFRGIPAKEVALNMLAHLPHRIKAVVYLNDLEIPPGTKGQAVVLERGKENTPPKLLTSVTLSEEERFTYYNVTTGADIPQHAFAQALLTVGKNITLRDLLQGVWRMRGLDKKQKVDFALPEALNLRSFEEMVELSVRNQATRQSSDNLGSLKKQIAYAGEALVLKALRDPELPIDQAISLSSAAEAILSPTLSMEPFALFGAVEREIPVETLIEEALETQGKALRELYRACPYLTQYAALEEIERRMREGIDFTILPRCEKRKKAEEYGASTEMRQKIEREEQAERQTELQLEVVQESAQEALPLHHFPQKLSPEDLWKNSYWTLEAATQTRSVNDFLIPRAGELTHFDPNKRVFSENLRLTGGVAPVGTSDFEKRGSFLFQKGTMPITLSALQIFPDGSKTLIFLDPHQADFINSLIKYKRQYKIEKAMQKGFKGRKVSKGAGSSEEKRLWEQCLSEDSPGESSARTKLNRMYALLDDYPHMIVQDAMALCNKTHIMPSTWHNSHLWYGESEKIFGGKGDFNLLLVDPKVGILQQGDLEVDPEELYNDPEYALLAAQAKFYNGDLDSYSPLERRMLTEWISDKGRAQMLSLLSNILRARPEDRARYPHSLLHTIFKTLSSPVQEEEKE